MRYRLHPTFVPNGAHWYRAEYWVAGFVQWDYQKIHGFFHTRDD